MSELEAFKKDVAKFYAFLMKHDIDAFTQNVSFEFLYSMLGLADIEGDTSYLKCICYYLKHLARYGGAKILAKED